MFGFRFFFSSRRRHTRYWRDWSSDVCSSDLVMDPARIWLLCRNQEIPLPFRTAVLVHLSSMFVASVTPGNVAVGPATALALRRLGVPLGKGVEIGRASCRERV